MKNTAYLYAKLLYIFKVLYDLKKYYPQKSTAYLRNVPPLL